MEACIMGWLKNILTTAMSVGTILSTSVEAGENKSLEEELITEPPKKVLELSPQDREYRVKAGYGMTVYSDIEEDDDRDSDLSWDSSYGGPFIGVGTTLGEWREGQIAIDLLFGQNSIKGDNSESGMKDVGYGSTQYTLEEDFEFERTSIQLLLGYEKKLEENESFLLPDSYHLRGGPVYLMGNIEGDREVLLPDMGTGFNEDVDLDVDGLGASMEGGLGWKVGKNMTLSLSLSANYWSGQGDGTVERVMIPEPHGSGSESYDMDLKGLELIGTAYLTYEF